MNTHKFVFSLILSATLFAPVHTSEKLKNLGAIILEKLEDPNIMRCDIIRSLSKDVRRKNETNYTQSTDQAKVLKLLEQGTLSSTQKAVIIPTGTIKQLIHGKKWNIVLKKKAGNSLLDAAVYIGANDIVEKLLTYLLNKNNLERSWTKKYSANKFGQIAVSPYHYAISGNNVEGLERLLINDPFMNILNTDNIMDDTTISCNSLLFWAAGVNCKDEIFSTLLHHHNHDTHPINSQEPQRAILACLSRGKIIPALYMYQKLHNKKQLEENTINLDYFKQQKKALGYTTNNEGNYNPSVHLYRHQIPGLERDYLITEKNLKKYTDIMETYKNHSIQLSSSTPLIQCTNASTASKKTCQNLPDKQQFLLKPIFWRADGWLCNECLLKAYSASLEVKTSSIINN